jgi:hypothetical protein
MLWLVTSAALLTSGCLAVNPTDGVLLCGPAPNVCPSGYQCGADQHCWRMPPVGGVTNDLAGTSADLSVNDNGGLDLSTPPLPGDDMTATPPPPNDLSVSHDLSMVSVPIVDMAQPKPGPDLATPPDMTVVFNYCPSGSVFCDNFESDTISITNAGNWTDTYVMPTNGGQTLATGTTEKHDGTHALHAAANNGADSWATLEYRLTSPAAALSLRMFVWPTTTLTNRGEVARLFSNTDVDGTGQRSNGYQIGGSVNGKWFISDSLGGSADHESNVAVATGTWTCFELVTSATGNVQLFINGSTTAAISFAPLKHEPYDTVHAGVEWAPGGVPVDVWTDEVAVSPNRLPCPTTP